MMDGWKHILNQTEVWWSPLLAGPTSVNLKHHGIIYAMICASGTLVIYSGYANNGVVPVPNQPRTIPAIRLLDVLSQWGALLTTSGRVAPSVMYRLFFEKMAEDGLHPFKTFVYWLAVRMFHPSISRIKEWYNQSDPALLVEETDKCPYPNHRIFGLLPTPTLHTHS